MTETESFTAFQGHRQVASGMLSDVAQGAYAAAQAGIDTVLIFDDATGQQIELDLRHSADQAVAEYRARTAGPMPAARPGRGRPKLGVVAREVTLLPRHWDWLAGQPGGASAALRRLVEDARRTGAGPERARRAQEALYRVMSVLAGDLPGFEDATRALFANDHDRLEAFLGDWPADVAAHLGRLTRELQV